MVVSDPVLAPDHLLATVAGAGGSRCQLVRFLSAGTLEGARAGRQLARALAFQVTQTLEEEDRTDSSLTVSTMESFRAIGLNYETQDLRFRDYQWQHEIFGVEGRGWLVRLNGVDIGRILRLESAAHEPLEQPTWSLTYLIGPLGPAHAGWWFDRGCAVRGSRRKLPDSARRR